MFVPVVLDGSRVCVHIRCNTAGIQRCAINSSRDPRFSGLFAIIGSTTFAKGRRPKAEMNQINSVTRSAAVDII